MSTQYSEIEIATKAYSCLGFPLRSEYQTGAIAIMANADRGAKKSICGCGGGKTLIMGISVALQIDDGRARKVVVVAPSIPLCRQLEAEFIDIFAALGIKKYINFVNVSSDEKKSKDLDADDLKEELGEEEDDKEVKKNRKADADYLCSKMGWGRDTIISHNEIEKELRSPNVTVFFVCKPSFFKNFRHRVSSVCDIDKDFEIDITCHDEFHDLISNEKKQKCKSALHSYSIFSRNNWFFSASKRSTEGLKWTDPLFGDLIIDVPSSQLVKWGYLVPNLKIYIVTASMIKNVAFSVRQKFEEMYGAKANDFLREARVVLKATEHQLSDPKIVSGSLGRNSMKGLLFSKRVAYTQEMKNSDEFNSHLQTLGTGFSLFQMDGSTKKNDRDAIFKSFRDLDDDVPAWLLQHSVCRQGINAPNFDVGILARGMSEISMQQALGRIQRKYEGKDCAYLYIYVDDIDYEESMKKLAVFLHYNLGDYEATVEKLVDDTSGSDGSEEDENSDAKKPNLSSVKVKLRNPKVIIEEYCSKIEKEEEKMMFLDSLKGKDFKDLISNLSFMR